MVQGIPFTEIQEEYTLVGDMSSSILSEESD